MLKIEIVILFIFFFPLFELLKKQNEDQPYIFLSNEAMALTMLPAASWRIWLTAGMKAVCSIFCLI